jgi:hypothetical protein
MLRRLYIITSALILLLYGWVGFTGKEFGNPERQKIPADARLSPGGYRSFHTWQSGYRGGK